MREQFEGQSNFAVFLRTGVRFRHPYGSDVEAKFNPWHDPDDGRFTFAGQGRFYAQGGGGLGTAGRSERQYGDRTRRTIRSERQAGRTTAKTSGGTTFTGGGGGSFRGGGATGSGWEIPDERARRATSTSTGAARLRQAEAGPTVVGVAAARMAASPRLQSTIKHGIRYDYDRTGRPRNIEGNLVLKAGSRNRKNQVRAGGSDRARGDDGGHYIAVRFNGSHSKLNHFAQNAGVNRGKYRAIEDRWAADLRVGRPVYVRIAPRYDGPSRRPYELEVRWLVDGKWRFERVPNEKGRQYDRRPTERASRAAERTRRRDR